MIDLIINSAIKSFDFSIEILHVLPPALILMGLLDAWLPKRVIENYLGDNSGIKGAAMSLLLGSFAAGPLFAAFPLASAISKKGGRTSNVAIFLGAWSTIKIPMLFIESHAMGFKFSFLRLILTIPFILLIGFFLEKWARLK